MGRGKHITEKEIIQMKLLKEEGYNYSEISKRIHRDRSTVSKFFKNGSNNKIETRGRHTSLTNRVIRRIRRLIATKPCSATYIKKTCGIKAHVQTIRNRMKRESIQWSKAKGKICISKINKIKRISFCKDNLTNYINWQKVIFSDEKSFSLDGVVNNIYGWSTKYNKHIIVKRHSRGGSVMVWGAITYDGQFRLCFVDGTLNGKKYVDILRCKLRGLVNYDYIFQQDNCPAHKSHICRNWMMENELNVLIWPAQSPDLNIIENVWGILTQKIYENGRQYFSKLELKREIFKAWLNLDKDYIKRLYLSVPKRLVECLEKKGGKTKY